MDSSDPAHATTTAPTMINLGCGHRAHPAWINIDHSIPVLMKRLRFLLTRGRPRGGNPRYIYRNLKRPLPFKSNSVDFAYSSHVLEHLQPDLAGKLLLEIYRVLRPGGAVRIVVPDLEVAARRYLSAIDSSRMSQGDPFQIQANHQWATIQLLDQLVRTTPGGEMMKWLRDPGHSDFLKTLDGIYCDIAAISPTGFASTVKRSMRHMFSNRIRSEELHRWMYDEVSLKQLLLKTGFSSVNRESFQTSRIPNWPAYQLDTDGSSPYYPDSLWMEATKPYGQACPAAQQTR